MILNFFSFIKNNIILHHHTIKAARHLHKHHKKYIFGSAIGFLFVKLLITLLTTVGGGTRAQEADNQYFIGDNIISQYEQCDDGNLEDGDGCNAAGQIESGYTCIGEPSICSFDVAQNFVQTGTLEQTGTSIQTGDLEFTGNIFDTGTLEIIEDLVQTGTLEQTGTLIETGNLEQTGTSIETGISQEPIIPIETGNLIQTGNFITTGILEQTDLTADRQVFKLSDLDNIDLINYFYGSGTQFTTNRKNNKCVLADLIIVHVQPGYNTIPNFLNGNTLYVLSSGSYDTKYMINIPNDCTAIIGLESGVVLHTTINKGANIKISSGGNNILYNLTLNGSTSSTGIIHSGNNYGIFVSTPDNSISNIGSYDTIGYVVYMENFNNNIFNISRFDSLFSGQIDNAVNTPIILPGEFTGDDIQQLLSLNGYTLSGDIWQGIRPFNLFQNSIFQIGLDIYSIDYKIKLSIGSGTRLVNSSGENYTGILLGPKIISTSTLKDNFSGQDIIYAFKVGADQTFVQSQDIDYNPKDFSVSVLLSDFTGENISLYHSLDGQTRTGISSLDISDIDSGISLKIDTDTFGQFVIVRENLIQTGTLELTGNLISTGTLIGPGTLIQTGILVETGILDLTGKITKGVIGEKIDDKTKKGQKKIIDEQLTGELLSGSALSGEQDQLIKNMEITADKKQKFKDKLRGRGYYENGAGKMIGTGDIDIGELSGEIDVPIIMQSTGITNIQVELPEGIFVKTASGLNYTGILEAPYFTTGNINIKNFAPIRFIKIGPDTPSLFFYDGSGNDAYVTVTIPTPELQIGKLVTVNYSNDLVNRNYLTDTTITDISGSNFAVFQTNHFTVFSLGAYTGTFTINNDAVMTTGTSVTLNISISGATAMKFGNTPAERDAAAWTGYTGTYLWTIANGTDGIKTVYAMFKNSETGYVTDKIILSTASQGLLSGLRWHIDSSSNAAKTIYYDISPVAANGSGYNTFTGVVNGEQYVYYNGSSAYIEKYGQNGITAYPFSISAWIKLSDLSATKKTIAGRARTSTNTRFWNLIVSGNKVGIEASQTTLYANFGTTSLTTGLWYHIIGVFASATQRNVFINNVSELTGTTSVTYSSSATSRRGIGRHQGGTPARYFSGFIDEVRVYNGNLASNGTLRQDIYMPDITAEPLTTFSTGPNLYGSILDDNTTISVTLSGTNNSYKQTYSAVNDGNSRWILSGTAITTPLNTGTYDIIVTETTPYGVTGATTFANYLVVQDQPTIDYTPVGETVVATLTGIDSTVQVTNNSGNSYSRDYIFTQTGNFTFNYVDNNGNTGSTLATVSSMPTPPAAATGYIYSGSTGYNSPNYYYKGNIDIKSDVSDNVGLATGTCMYTVNGSAWNSASYSGTITTGYCYKTGVVGGSDLYIRFSIQDNEAITGYSSTGVYIYDGTAPAVAGGGSTGADYLRVTQGGGANTDYNRGVEVDDLGNVYVAGDFAGTPNFGSTTITSSGSSDGFIAKLSSTGTYQRAVKGGGASLEQERGITLDNEGNGYYFGQFNGSASFGSTTLTSSGSSDAYIAKVSSTGEQLRARKGGGVGTEFTRGATTDSSGNVYMIGYSASASGYYGPLGFVGSGSSDVLVAKLSSTGERLRLAHGQGIDADVAYGAVTDSGGNIYVVGYYSGPIKFGSTTLTNSGGTDVFVAKLSSTGERLRATQGGGTAADTPHNITIDSQGNLYVAGDFSSTADFGTTTLTSSGLTDVFVAKLSSTGQRLQAVKGGGLANDLGYEVAIDSTGNIYMGGYFSGTASFGTTTLTSSGLYDVFLAKLSSTGAYQRATKGGGTGTDYGYSVDVDNAGNIYIAGGFSSTASFGTSIVISSGGNDTFVAKLASNIGSSLFKINNDATSTTSQDVTLNITCPTDAGVNGVQISYGNTTGTYGAWTGCTTTKSHTLTAGGGEKTVYMRVQDALGNISDDSSDTITLELDGPPILSTGYISSGSTGYNSPNYYYKGNIDIKSDVTNAGGLATGTCMYTTGSSRAAALYSGTSTAGYCYKTGIVGSSTLDIRFYILDNTNNTGYANTGAYIYDATAPTGLAFKINNDATGTNVTGVTLNITCPTDAGVNGVEIAYGTGSTPTNRTGCATTKPFTLSTGDGIKTVYMRTRDMLANTTSDITDTIILDNSLPVLSTGYISSGSTGYNSPNYYYKGDVDIRSDITDAGGLNTGTCMYTVNGSTWNSALYSGTSNTGYCYKTGIVGGSTLDIRFSIQDNIVNTGYANTGTYIYDITSPAVGGGGTGINYARATQGGGGNFSVDVDSGGNSYIVGIFYGTQNFGSTTLTSSGLEDTFIAKVSSTGEYLRATKGGGAGSDFTYGVDVDSGGNLYVAGIFASTANFGSTTLVSSGLEDTFIAKVSSTGAYLRAVKGGGTDTDQAYGVAVDSLGNSYIAGHFIGTAKFGSTTLTSSGLEDTFIAKVSSTGAYLRAVKGGGTDTDQAYGVAVDSLGNSYIAGHFIGTAKFGSTTLVSSGLSDAFVAKVSSTGVYLRATKGGGTELDKTNGIGADSNGNVYIAGAFLGTANFGSTTLVSSGNDDPFVAKLSSTGVWLRATKGGGDGRDQARGIAVDSLGNSYIAGHFSNTGIFGSTTLVESGSQDVFVAKLSSTGAYLRALKGGGIGQDFGQGVATDNLGNTYIVGSFALTGTFGSTTLEESFGNQFIAKISGNEILFTINNDDATTTGTEVTLNITCPTDAGVSGVQMAYGNSASPTNWTGCATSQAHTLEGGVGIKTVYMAFRDALGNTTDDVTGTIELIDNDPPTVGTAEIYSGTTGYNNPNYYYKGVVDIRATVSDAGGISGSTCGYTTGGLRSSATYSGAGGYCYVEGIDPQMNIEINFKVEDLAGNLGTGTLNTYIYDNTTPTGLAFTINNDDAGTTTTGVILNITCPTDAGVEGVEIAYGSSTLPTNRTGCATTKSRNLTEGDATKTVYMATRDALGNTTSDITDTIVLDTTGPSIPELISPTSGQTLNTGTVDLLRSGSIDAGIGLSGYVRQLSTGSAFTNILNSGSVLTTGKTITGLTNETYYRRVYAYDIIGNTGTRTGINFSVMIPLSLTNISPTSGQIFTDNLIGFSRTGESSIINYIANIYSGGSLYRSQLVNLQPFAIKYGGTGSDFSYGTIAQDSDYNIIWPGFFLNTASFGTTTLESSGVEDIAINKISSTGARLRSIKAGGNGQDFPRAAAVDSDNNIYLVGRFSTTASFGTTTLVSSGGTDAFIAKIDSGGNRLRATKIGGTAADENMNVKIDSDDNIYVNGYFSDTVSFGDTTFTSSGGQDIFIAKIDSGGNRLRASKAGGTATTDTANKSRIGNSGDIYIAGSISGTASFGPYSLTTNGGQDAYAAKISNTGVWLRATKGGGSSIYDYGNGIAVDSAENVYLVGSHSSSPSSFGPFSISTAGSDDIYI